MSRTLLSFVDLKDPFLLSDVAGEELTGPVLSMLAARSFESVHLFYAGQASENANATRDAIRGRHRGATVHLHEIGCASPKDYSGIMGAVAREVRRLPAAENYVCVSSGTAEMRATWFLLTASGVLDATLLQIGSPAEPLFGPAHVQEVQFDGENWSNLRDLVMPQAYFEESAAEEQFTPFLSRHAVSAHPRRLRRGFRRSPRRSACTSDPQLSNSRPKKSKWPPRRTSLCCYSERPARAKSCSPASHID